MRTFVRAILFCVPVLALAGQKDKGLSDEHFSSSDQVIYLSREEFSQREMMRGEVCMQEEDWKDCNRSTRLRDGTWVRTTMGCSKIVCVPQLWYDARVLNGKYEKRKF